MINLILAVLCGTMITCIMRFSDRYTDPHKQMSMLLANYVVCVILAVFYTGIGTLWSMSSGKLKSLGLGSINGVIFFSAYVLLQISTTRNGVVLSATFMKLGVLVPTVLSVIIFGEKPSIFQILGFLIAIAAIIAINTPDRGTDLSADFKSGLFLLLILGGTADFMSKIYEEAGSPDHADQFLVYTFLFACILCFVTMVCRHQKTGIREILFGVLLAFPNYFSTRFLLKAIGEIPAVVAYPTFSVASIVAASAAGMVLFGEKLSARQKKALLAIMVALVLLNI